ncbi:MAG: class I SAM-dependent methyltransferase [Halioglobus sp.]|nr:class I SAM-dependent methyltransferase [Halioglobus sp.]
MPDLTLEVPQKIRRGRLRWDEQRSVASGVELLKLLASSLGHADLANLRVLDIGCGCKFTQAILDRGLPVGQYVGVDVYGEMIEFLRSSVSDERFEFHHINTHNEMYNPDGEELSDATRLPIAENSFDIICAFSVFTHLAPADYVAMLKMLRRYIKPDGHLFFTVFINEETAGGFGRVDLFKKAMQKAERSQLEKHKDEFVKSQREGIPDFVDAIPEQPLRAAIYSRKHALELMEDTGWHIDSLNDPLMHIQHYMICSPA